VDAFRLNFSHGDHEGHRKVIKALREVEAKSERSIAIIADMQGPKLRVGPFKKGGITLTYGQEVTLELSDELGEDGIIRLQHPELFKAIAPDQRLKFDDGKLMVTILSVDGERAQARVDVPGELKDRKGLNVIDAVLPMSAMTDKDRVDMEFVLGEGVDFIALSFVQTAQDVIEAREIIGDQAGIIVKIEKPSAVEQLDAILAEADAAMVARGDLGVELPLEQVPVVQRQIIRKARALGKPVIVATHMLESMIDSPTPTRAEASDVATAIYQGTDAVMLSAETAVGRHPATAVAIMDRIITSAESDPEYWSGLGSNPLPHRPTTEDAISQSIRTIVETLECTGVLGYTLTGSTVRRISRERPRSRIVGLTPNAKTASQLALSWGVQALITDDPSGFNDMLLRAEQVAISALGKTTGDQVLVAAGIPFGRPGRTDTLKIATIS
jgi:pyruvate kinase